MLLPRKIQSIVRPEKIQKLGNGTYYYNYDIQESLVTQTDMNQESNIVTVYTFIQVHLQGLPDYKKCVREIIRSFITIDEEFDLINSYNSYTNKLNVDSSIISEYLEYLNKLKEIKDKVKKDFGLK